MGITDESRDKIIKPIYNLGFDKKDLIVVGGAALELFGIRQANDVDLVIRERKLYKYMLESPAGVDDLNVEYGKVVKRKGILLAPSNGYEAARYSKISFMAAPNDNLYQATYDDLIEEAVQVEGVMVSPLERILEWKLAVSRDKDLDDIGLIETHLQS